MDLSDQHLTSGNVISMFNRISWALKCVVLVCDYTLAYQTLNIKVKTPLARPQQNEGFERFSRKAKALGLF